MYFVAVALDYDGTVAHDGLVDEQTLAALEAVKKTGRKLILVTGRELDDLKRAFPQYKVFDRIVAENGALLYQPGTGEETHYLQVYLNQMSQKLEPDPTRRRYLLTEAGVGYRLTSD